MMKLNWQVICIALLAGLTGLAFSLKLKQERELSQLPDFFLPNLQTSAMLSAADLPAGDFIVNFWASWCLSCRVEHPLLVQLAANGISIVGVNFHDNDTRAQQWLDNLGDPYIFSLADRKGYFGDTHLGVVSLPETLFISKSGRIVYRRTGELRLEHAQAGLQALGLDDEITLTEHTNSQYN